MSSSSSSIKSLVDINDLQWKEDADTPSTVDDTWPSEDTIIQTSPLRKNGQSAKIIAFAHEEYPLERPPINCRLLYDTTPVTSSSSMLRTHMDDHRSEDNDSGILDFSCRVLLSALNFPPSPRRQSYPQKDKSTSSSSHQFSHEIDDHRGDLFRGPKSNRFRSHMVSPLPSSSSSATLRNSLQTVQRVENFQQHQSSSFLVHSNDSTSPPEMVVQVPSTSSALQTHSPLPTLEDHHARASLVESFIASSPPLEEEDTEDSSSHSSSNKYMLSSFTSWWSSGSRVAPKALTVHNVNVATSSKPIVHDGHDPKTVSIRSVTITPTSTPSSSPNSSDDHLQGKYDDEKTTPMVDSSHWLPQSHSLDSNLSSEKSTLDFPNPPPNSLRLASSPRSHIQAPISPGAFAVPRGISPPLVPIISDNLANTAATMHAVRAWSSPSTANNSTPPSPLLTVPVRVVRTIRTSSSSSGANQ